MFHEIKQVPGEVTIWLSPYGVRGLDAQTDPDKSCSGQDRAVSTIQNVNPRPDRRNSWEDVGKSHRLIQLTQYGRRVYKSYWPQALDRALATPPYDTVRNTVRIWVARPAPSEPASSLELSSAATARTRYRVYVSKNLKPRLTSPQKKEAATVATLSTYTATEAIPWSSRLPSSSLTTHTTARSWTAAVTICRTGPRITMTTWRAELWKCCDVSKYNWSRRCSTPRTLSAS